MRHFQGDASAARLAPALLLSVALQEGAARPLLWRCFKRLDAALAALARAERLRPLSRLDALHVALAAGLGHGLAHAAAFSLATLALALSPATLYADACPQMSLYTGTSLATLALVLLHCFSMVAAFHGYAHRKVLFVAVAPALHAAAALASLASLARGGCVATVVLLLLAAAAALGAAAAALEAELASAR